ncbi:hypothetical protein HYH03_006134 [Edaphochlamys debaryana]|uniref:Cytochrome P450 n=1 Tax=Edaphochlamys debaryana TaxID=47281 RepID=A0A836C0J3_9CHLO|nr:hypothetical protein HYH03_006134 [Edaphochlamys debaryana]|eukprot:KAG2495896.1 hypothetical protein HYH03_006134 [Edaphochlamys debaryana]
MLPGEPGLWLYASTAALGLVFIWLLSKATTRRALGKGKQLPVASGLPLLGHSLTLRSGDRRLTALRAWSTQYDGVFGLSRGLLGGPLLVVLSDPAAVHGLLALGEDVAPKSKRFYGSIEEVLHPSGPAPSCLTATAAAAWGPVRRSLLHAFSAEELREDFLVAKAKAYRLAALLQDLGPGVILDADDAGCRLALDVLGVSKLGYDFEAVEATGEVLLLRLLGEVRQEWEARRRRPLGPLTGWVSDRAAEGGLRCRILADFVAQELWGDIEARGPPPPDDTTLAAQLVRLWSPPAVGAASAAPGVTHDRAAAELASLLMYGMEPAGHCIAWALHCLAHNRAAQDKLVAELKREGVYDNPASLTYDMLPRLPYLDAVVRETLRLYPPCACPATVRSLRKPVVLGGTALPSGAEVWVDVWSMHRCPRLWRDPDRFNPERWTDASARPSPVPGPAGAAAGGKGKAGGKKGAARGVKAAGGDGGDGNAAAAVDADAAAAAAAFDGLSTLPTDGGSAASAAPPAAAVAAALASAATTSTDAPLCSPLAFLPFGVGPRCCLGQGLALAEVKAALAVLVGAVAWEPSGEPGDEPRLAAGLFVRPEGGVHLLIAPRKR